MNKMIISHLQKKQIKFKKMLNNIFPKFIILIKIITKKLKINHLKIIFQVNY